MGKKIIDNWGNLGYNYHEPIKTMIHIKSKLKVSLFRDGRDIIAYCPALDLCSCGKTEREAKKNFEECLKIYLDETIKHGTLEKDLLRLGWKKHTEDYSFEPPPEEHARIPHHILKQFQIPVPALS